MFGNFRVDDISPICRNTSILGFIRYETGASLVIAIALALSVFCLSAFKDFLMIDEASQLLLFPAAPNVFIII